MTTYSVDGTLTIPFNIIQNASDKYDLFCRLLNGEEIETVSITTKTGDTYILNHYDYIETEYKEDNIEEI